MNKSYCSLDSVSLAISAKVCIVLDKMSGAKLSFEESASLSFASVVLSTGCLGMAGSVGVVEGTASLGASLG